MATAFMCAVAALWLGSGAFWLRGVIRAKRSRRPFAQQQRDWRNEWKP